MEREPSAERADAGPVRRRPPTSADASVGGPAERTRREMISVLVAGAVHAAAASGIEASQPQQRRWGVQLYTVRDLIARDAASTIGAIAAMGYKELEILQP